MARQPVHVHRIFGRSKIDFDVHSQCDP